MESTTRQPGYHILICLIQIWDCKDNAKLMVVPQDAMMISEAENINIVESYKTLIGTASVRFPRGTVIRKTVDKFNESEAAANKLLHADISDSGVIEEVRKTTSSVSSPESFKIGQRIRIYLGYTEDPVLASYAKTSNSRKSIFNDVGTLNKYKKAMNLMFDGYITKISVDTPVELQCENLASGLKKVSCPKITVKSKETVNSLLGAKSKHHLLRGTGLKLHPSLANERYDLGKLQLDPSLTVADLLTEWSKFGLHCFVKEYNGEPVIVVGRSYFSNAGKDSIVNSGSNSAQPIKILFDYNVASNDLKLMSTDKQFLAVYAEGVGKDNKFFNLTLLRNPNYGKVKGATQFRVENVSALSKKAMKMGIKKLDKSKDHVDMNLYTKISYHSRKIPVTQDELIEEAKKYFESYNMNGIEGTLKLFGDLHLHTATKVELVDNRYPGKNGYYLVEEVNTTFGNGGYRQSIKLPYCIKRNGNKSGDGKQ